MIENETFDGLYRAQLQDLYDAEQQIIEALPVMMQAATSADLKAVFRDHLQETKVQLRRLEYLFAGLNEPAGTNICGGIRALIAAGNMRINELRSSPVLDVALIAAAGQIERYEICGYETARMLAEMLGHQDAGPVLKRTLDEERETASILTELAEALVIGEETEEAETEAVKV